MICPYLRKSYVGAHAPLVPCGKPCAPGKPTCAEHDQAFLRERARLYRARKAARKARAA